ncbi:MAG: hypothetical protein GY862_13250 [Gammaproteobacteria bacterium]|nr:hypothetical protein [Gammaproteobacteria bacterium]
MLQSVVFHDLLFKIDQELAAEAQKEGCPHCGCPLHQTNYPRKPRGGPQKKDERRQTRFSFCCCAKGCRRRLTPFSVRFLGRKVYLGAAIVLLTVLCHGITPARAEKLQASLGVNRRTLKRWRTWWQKLLVGSQFWNARQGLLNPPPEHTALPSSLLDCFHGALKDQLLALLRFLSPVTSASAPGNQAF